MQMASNKKHPGLLAIGIFLFYVLLSILRYPTYIQVHNFYAEDGSVFFYDAFHHGIMSLFQTFNGYPIFGIRLAALLGNYLSFFPIIHNLSLAALATSTISYCIWAASGFFTYLTLRARMPKIWAVSGGFLVVLVPVNGWNYAILGSIGNQKFIFLFFAFLLLMQRFSSSKWLRTNKVLFCLCCLTNPLCFMFAPFFLIANGSLKNRHTLIELIQVAIFLVFGGWIFFMSRKAPLPASYTSGSWNKAHMMNVMFGRTILFPISSYAYSSYHTILLILIILLVFEFLRIRNVSWLPLIIGLFGALISVLITLESRLSLSQFFRTDYNPGPAQFFYAENMITIFCIFLMIYNLVKSKIRSPFLKSAILVVLIFFDLVGNYRGIGFWGIGPNSQWQRSFRGIGEEQAMACSRGNSSSVHISIVPGNPWGITFPRQTICTK
jgi:hypothetical protein